MSGIPSLKYREKVLIYLNKFYESIDDDNQQIEVTQEGISKNIEMSRTHVSRTVRKLIKENLVEEKKSHIKGKNRKLKTYHLTHEGHLKSKQLISELSKIEMKVIRNGKENNISLDEIHDFTDGKIDTIKALNRLQNGKKALNLDGRGPLNPIVKTEDLTKTEDKLYGRKEELNELYDWMDSNIPVLILLGRKGFGNSSLTSKFIQNIENRHVLSVNISKNSGEEAIQKIRNFSKEINENYDEFTKDLKSQRCLLILDDYYQVPDKVVDFLSELLDSLDKKDDLKILINAREGTPVYERFYTMDDINDDKVKEISLSPLNKKDAQKLLGNSIEEGSLRRIMQFTKGSPLLLKLLRDDEREKLEKMSPLSKEQVSLLMFLKTKTE